MAEARFLKCSCSHCGGHIEFPDEAVGVAVNCPHCGKETVLSGGGAKSIGPKKGRSLLVIGVLVGVLAMAGAATVFFLKSKKTDSSTKSLAEKADSTPVAPAPESAEPAATTEATMSRGEDLQVVQFTLPKSKAKGSSVVYVQGSVTNQAKVQYFSLKVEFDLLNSKGDKIGTAKDQLANLAPHAVWNFKALVVGKDVASVKLASLKGEKE